MVMEEAKKEMLKKEAEDGKDIPQEMERAWVDEEDDRAGASNGDKRVDRGS